MKMPSNFRYGSKIRNDDSKLKSHKQMQIDNENNNLLSKIIVIMKRKNKSMFEKFGKTS